MKLKNRVTKDWRSIQSRANAMYEVAANDIGKMIEIAGKDIIGTVAATLSMTDKITYQRLSAHGLSQHLESVIQRRLLNLAIDVENYWTYRRKDFDLFARVSMGFISTKTSPPWVKKQLNLKSELAMDGELDPRRGHIRFYFKKMGNLIMNQINQGALQEESLNKILSRIRALFNRKKAMGVREDNSDLEHDVDITDDGNYEETLSGMVDVAEGTYTLEDVAELQNFQQRAMQWESRQYRPWFSDEIKRNNRYLRELEQLLMSDSINQMHEGMLQQQMGYPDEMGIEDFQWVVSRPQPRCDCCTDRDGLTMSEIKDQIQDEFEDQPPPLHPNCRCQLVPKINEDWSKKVLQNDGQEWDPEDGIVYNADDQEIDNGINDMTLDQYLASIPR